MGWVDVRHCFAMAILVLILLFGYHGNGRHFEFFQPPKAATHYSGYSYKVSWSLMKGIQNYIKSSLLKGGFKFFFYLFRQISWNIVGIFTVVYGSFWHVDKIQNGVTMETKVYVKFYVSIIIHLEVININVRNCNFPIGFYSNLHPLWTPQNMTLTPFMPKHGIKNGR
jgi:hypothetical protein